jgi:uncharacterized membrane protein
MSGEMVKTRLTSRYLAQVGIIAGLYAGLTVAFGFISYGPLQVRISEALTVLPVLFPAAIPGLALGCAVANIFGPYGLLDVVVGSTLTLLAALLTARVPRLWMAPLPPILVNAAGLALYLPTMTDIPFLSGAPHLFTFLSVAAGQSLACYGLGYPLLLVLGRRRLGRGANTG